MKSLFQEIRNRIDAAELIRRTEELCKIEQGQTFRHYHQSIDYICALMRREKSAR